jgi:hypothetical protein
MRGRIIVNSHIAIADPDGEGADSLGALGRILRQVRRYRRVGDLTRSGDIDYAGVNLSAPGDFPAAGTRRMIDGGERGCAGGSRDNGCELAVIALGGMTRAGSAGLMPSSRKMAWKWTMPRA